MKGNREYVEQSQLQKVDNSQQLISDDDSGSLEKDEEYASQYVSQITTNNNDTVKKTLPQLSVNQQIVDDSSLEKNQTTPSSSPKSFDLTFVGSGSGEHMTNYAFSLSSRSNSLSNSRKNSTDSSESNNNESNVQTQRDSSPDAHLVNAGQYEKVISDINIMDFLRYLPRISLRSLSNGKYVIPKNCDALKVMAVKPNNATQQQILWVKEPSQNPHLKPHNDNSQPEKIALRTFYQRFWSSTHTGKLLPDCEKSLPGPHEMFTVVPCTFVDRSHILTHSKATRKNSESKPSNGVQESCLALMCSNGNFVGLEWGSDGESQLGCLSRALTVNELFQPLSQIGFKLINDSFLSCTNQKKLSTRSTKLGPQEIFTLSFENNGCAVVTAFNTYLSAEIDGNISAKTPADPSRRSSQELFQLEVYRIPHKFGDLKFALKTCYNNYIRADTEHNIVKADRGHLDDNCLFIIRAARLGSLAEFMQETPFSKHHASLISSTDSEVAETPSKSPSKLLSFPKKLRNSWMSLFASESNDEDAESGPKHSSARSTIMDPSPYSTPRVWPVPSTSPQPSLAASPQSTRSANSSRSPSPTPRSSYRQPDTLLVGVDPETTPTSDLRKYDPTPLNEIEAQWKIQWNELKFTKRCLGMGYFGKVMEATWKGTNVACKFIYRENFRTKNDFDMFLHEVKMMSILRHPCICQFLGIAFNDQAYCIVTELLYCSVYDLVREDIFLLHSLPKLRWNIAYHIAQGVCYMHSRDPPILHRDLSSKNVLLQQVSLSAKVADFGLSRAKSEKMSVGTGALQWMAPEVFQGSKYTELCDVFSFAIILYELWTGDDPVAEVCQHGEEGEINLTEYALKMSSGVRPALPSAIPLCWQSLIQQCWATTPDSRPSFTKIIEILDTFPEASAENVSVRNSQVKNLPPFLQQLVMSNQDLRNDNNIIVMDGSSSSTDSYQRAPQSLQNFPETSPSSSTGSHYYGEDVPPYMVLDPLASSSSGTSGSGYLSTE